MALGGSSRMSRKGDLIIRINLERNHQGMEYKEVLKEAKKLWSLTIEELERAYKDLLAQRK